IQTIEHRQFDLVILNSPHNPSGILYPPQQLMRLIDSAERNSVLVVLDEAFVDYVPEASLVSFAGSKSNLIVFRSLTKFYAMPALRIGYAVCSPDLAASMAMQLDPWPVSTIALQAGRLALQEIEYEEQSRIANAAAREEFVTALRSIGLTVFSSVANFLLIKLHSSSGGDLALWLEKRHTLIRTLNSLHGLEDSYVRLAVRMRTENLQLVSKIQAFLLKG
ncbi:aminotransferase class I/II-fold pyridoxal phosphate-dependent enzyme, partial [bacterium]|nr:aminotransferase class I/II-fold pyridoxal phosphate-dependent enzyme [bacterium]